MRKGRRVQGNLTVCPIARMGPLLFQHCEAPSGNGLTMQIARQEAQSALTIQMGRHCLDFRYTVWQVPMNVSGVWLAYWHSPRVRILARQI
jgi:hypothetical protein